MLIVCYIFFYLINEGLGFHYIDIMIYLTMSIFLEYNFLKHDLSPLKVFALKSMEKTLLLVILGFFF